MKNIFRNQSDDTNELLTKFREVKMRKLILLVFFLSGIYANAQFTIPKNHLFKQVFMIMLMF